MLYQGGIEMKKLMLVLMNERIKAYFKSKNANMNIYASYWHTNVFDSYTEYTWVSIWYKGLFQKKMTENELFKMVLTNSTKEVGIY